MTLTVGRRRPCSSVFLERLPLGFPSAFCELPRRFREFCNCLDSFWVPSSSVIRELARYVIGATFPSVLRAICKHVFLVSIGVLVTRHSFYLNGVQRVGIYANLDRQKASSLSWLICSCGTAGFPGFGVKRG